MSGKIEVIAREGVPKRTDLKYYPYWSWKITDESDDKKSVIITPEWSLIRKALLDTIIHEMKVDVAIDRKPDTQRYRKFISDVLETAKQLQTKVMDFELEDIYKNAKNKQ